MADEIAAAIAARAHSHIGIPFRLKGRSANSGFDCVGLVADAVSVAVRLDVMPADYSLRGDYAARIAEFLQGAGFRHLCEQPMQSGDILVLRTAPRQLHLAIMGNAGFVHAHAGLGRIVHTPLPLPWPLLGHWRFIGD